MSKENKVNEYLIKALIDPKGKYRKSKSNSIYYIFDIEAFYESIRDFIPGRGMVAFTGFENSASIPKHIRSHIRQILREFSKNTGFSFKEVSLNNIPYVSMDEENLLFICTTTIPIGNKLSAATKPTIFNKEGLASGKSLYLSPEFIKKYFDSKKLFDHRVLHEIFHVLGLKHPESYTNLDNHLTGFDYGESNCWVRPTCYDTIMSYLCFAHDCVEDHPDNKTICESYLPNPLYFPVDIIATQYQQKGQFPKTIDFYNCTPLDKCLNKVKTNPKECFDKYPLYVINDKNSTIELKGHEGMLIKGKKFEINNKAPISIETKEEESEFSLVSVRVFIKLCHFLKSTFQTSSALENRYPIGK